MQALNRVIHFLARWTAILGGFVLLAITVITVVSITGRALIFAGLRPVPGDFELVEAGTAFAVFAFLPVCMLRRGHATVEILTARFPDSANRFIEVVVNVLMFAVAVLIGWRHWLGTLDKMSFGETTFILQFPIWWAYAASLFGAAMFVIVAAYCVLRSLIDLFGGRDPETAEARH